MTTELLLGLTVGVILALTGAGGGILAVPFLVFGAGLSVLQAAPIGLLAVGMAAALGAVLGLKEGIVRYKAALLMATVGMVLAPLGVWLGGRVDNRWLTLIFAAVLLLVAYRTYKQARTNQQEDKLPVNGEPPCIVSTGTDRFSWTPRCARSLAGAGAVAGLVSGLIGVGGGFVMVPALKRYTDLAMQSVVATSLAVIALVSVSSVASSTLAGSLNWHIALPFAGATALGMLIGRMLSSRLAGPLLQKSFATVSAMVAFGMGAKVIFQLV